MPIARRVVALVDDTSAFAAALDGAEDAEVMDVDTLSSGSVKSGKIGPATATPTGAKEIWYRTGTDRVFSSVLSPMFLASVTAR